MGSSSALTTSTGLSIALNGYGLDVVADAWNSDAVVYVSKMKPSIHLLMGRVALRSCLTTASCWGATTRPLGTKPIAFCTLFARNVASAQ
jgi:hypothetical protein